MNILIGVVCWAVIIYSVWSLPIRKFIVAAAACLILISCLPQAKADGQTMSVLHYSQFRDVFMMAKCLEVGRADRMEFADAYGKLKARDPMAVMVVQSEDKRDLGLYLGDGLSMDLLNVIHSFEIMDEQTLKTYCKYTSLRATAPR